MNIIIVILIFFLVLFIYLHIFYHIKTSNDLEVFELSQLSKERLEEICDFRQPLTFNLNLDSFDKLRMENISDTYGSFDIKLRDLSSNDMNSELFLPVVIKKGLSVLQNDNNNQFISENNQDFLQETSLIKVLKANDAFLRPSMMIYSNYDYMMGSAGTTTPFRYKMDYRHFIVVLNGNIKVKLTPPKNKKYLYPENDYDNFEFRSPVNPWKIQKKYKPDFDKIKCLDLELVQGNLLYIPAYWWYSIKFEDSKNVVLSFNYRTYMNTMAILPRLFISFLQKQNIKHDIMHKIVK
jgi:hypothetical protein